ncbi:hypothetical protein [Streptomyces sp. NPDC058872]|uniref:hypothetical protein n=1 Tax=Streptomyces sp. NPDC058872 TaxID=3346661 RepID=UPI003696F21F
MKPDFYRDLMPSDAALHLVGALNTIRDKLHDASQQWKLLDETGRIPDTPSYTVLLQHAIGAQDLSREVLQLTAGFAQSPHHTTRAGSAVLKRLSIAATMSSHAVPRFTETAEEALGLPQTTALADRDSRTNRMVINHASARAYLRRASESLHHAVEELDDHLGFQRFLATLTPQEGPPAPPPPKPGGRHR